MKVASFALVVFACACASQTPPAEPPPRGAADAISSTAPLPDNVDLKEAIWYSEQVQVTGRIFLPASAQMSAKAAAVVLAPGEARTAESLDGYAIALAQNGIVALTIDYRGWGRSGAHLYLGERVDTYDKMRFSEQTPELVFRRGRIDPDHQVQDLRNAISFLQGSPTVDPARIGVLGVGLGGGHVVSVMSMDTRARVGVAVTPDIPGQGEEERSFLPDAAMQAEMIRLAREGAPPKTQAAARARNLAENRIALAEYKPYWRLDAIPQTAALRFIVAETDDVLDNAVNARAAAGELKGPNDVKSLPGALHELTSSQTSEAASLAAEWFRQRL